MSATYQLMWDRAYPNKSGPDHPGYRIRHRNGRYEALFGCIWRAINATSFVD